MLAHEQFNGCGHIGILPFSDDGFSQAPPPVEDQLRRPVFNPVRVPQCKIVIDGDGPRYSLLLQILRDVRAASLVRRFRAVNTDNREICLRQRCMQRTKFGNDVLAVNAIKCKHVHDDDLICQ